MEINIYDFDGTIYNGDSSLDFYKFCLFKNKKILKYFFPFLYCTILYKFGRKTKEQLKSSFFKYICEFENINDIVEEFWQKKYKNIKSFYLNRNHDKDIIISASPFFLLKPICDRLKVLDLIASNVNEKTGEFIDKNCHGEEKVIKLKQKYNNIIVLEAYSDSICDKPILELAKKSYLVKKQKIVEYRKK